MKHWLRMTLLITLARLAALAVLLLILYSPSPAMAMSPDAATSLHYALGPHSLDAPQEAAALSSTVSTTAILVWGRAPIVLNWSAQDGAGPAYSVTLLYKKDANSWQWGGQVFAQGSLTGTFIFTPPDVLSAPVITYSFASIAEDGAGHSEPLPSVADVQVQVRPLQVYLPAVPRDFPPIPGGAITIETGLAYTYRRAVTLHLTATVSADTVSQVRFKNDGEDWGAWRPFSSPLPFTLPAGNGLKVVTAQFRGVQGGVSPETTGNVLLFENGDFEQDLAIAWQNENGGLPVTRVNTTVDGTPLVLPGSAAALLGSTGFDCYGVPNGYSGLRQTVRVPAQGGKLKFQYFIRTQDASPTGKRDYDLFEVDVNGNMVFNDANRNMTNLSCAKWWRIPGPENIRHGQADGWAEETVDLTPYAGQTIEISFRTYSRYDNYYNTFTYLDNVRLEP